MNEALGKLAGIYIGAQKGEGKTEVETAELIADHGLRGDSHAGSDQNRQVSLFAKEVLVELQAEGFKVSAGELSANLFTENLLLDQLAPGAQIRIGEAIVEIVEPRKPCRSITRIDRRLPKRLAGRCGQLGKVLVGGQVNIGEKMRTL